MAFIITEPCLTSKDGSCVDVCPVDCIKTGPDQPQYYIDPAVCISCAACVDACPSKAIYADDQVPAQWLGYIQKNAAYFAVQGSV